MHLKIGSIDDIFCVFWFRKMFWNFLSGSLIASYELYCMVLIKYRFTV